MAAICLTSLLTMAFIFIGQVNVLAPIVTINFMLTYSFIDYSYFSVAMTSQLQTKLKRNTFTSGRKKRRRSTRQSSRPLIESALPNYGSGGESPQAKGTLLEFTKDMDQIFPTVSKLDSGTEATPSREEHQSRKATPKQKLMASFGLDLNRNEFSQEKEEEICSAPPEEEAEVQREDGELKAAEKPQVKYAETSDSNTGDSAHPSNFRLDAICDAILLNRIRATFPKSFRCRRQTRTPEL